MIAKTSIGIKNGLTNDAYTDRRKKDSKSVGTLVSTIAFTPSI